MPVPDPKDSTPMILLSGGGPNNHLSAVLEPCGTDDPMAWLHGQIEMSLFGNVNCTMHVDAIACTIKKDDYGISTAIAEDPELQPTLEAYYELNGGEEPQLVDRGGRTYCVLIYPHGD